ncbi:hypothetical protein COCMIDRAFT_100060 [Bipolaris oryzae ATCC 44560]|uniref:Uncharacterized protein n=1 Tax=Bipolaris oryzae ATCC 44560 TaxID=930090 RepID=W6ZJH4_COCMI|nr:uncharacterized protein COCMIDRAFT_100060 [Bipolaris oryzae ATCC 44560]EUC43741.1 hypothetical protein COCMIDRAFT_100060 [Bipolaris oryzae ATCC 44560]
MVLLGANIRSTPVTTSNSERIKVSVLYGLDENSKKPILVFKLCSDAKGPEVKTECGLCAKLDNDKYPLLPFLYVTKKLISRRDSHLEILNKDLLLPSVLKWCFNAAIKASLVDVKLALLAGWRHKLTGAYKYLFIVSRAHHPWPEASMENHPESGVHELH